MKYKIGNSRTREKKSLHIIHIVNAIWIDSICGKRDSIEKPYIFPFLWFGKSIGWPLPMIQILLRFILQLFFSLSLFHFLFAIIHGLFILFVLWLMSSIFTKRKEEKKNCEKKMLISIKQSKLLVYLTH